MEQAPLEVVTDAGAIRHLTDPARRVLLEELAEPATAAELARRLEQPRQRIGYHLRELEAAGLVTLVRRRRKRNFMERVLQARARTFVVSPEATGAGEHSVAEGQDRFSWAFLVGLAARVVRDLALLRQRADAAGRRLQTLGIETEIRFASIGHQVAFAQELTDAVDRLHRKYNDRDAREGRTVRLVCGAYPRVKRPADSKPGGSKGES